MTAPPKPRKPRKPVPKDIESWTQDRIATEARSFQYEACACANALGAYGSQLKQHDIGLVLSVARHEGEYRLTSTLNARPVITKSITTKDHDLQNSAKVTAFLVDMFLAVRLESWRARATRHWEWFRGQVDIDNEAVGDLIRRRVVAGGGVLVHESFNEMTMSECRWVIEVIFTSQEDMIFLVCRRQE